MNRPTNMWLERLARYGPLVFWIGVILILGSGSGSMTQTSRIIGPLLAFLFPSASPETYQFVHGIVRKCAHFFEYALLALLAVRAFRRSSAPLLRRHWAGFAFMAAMAVAGTDEVSQSFNAERTGSGWDFLLDLTGAASAICLCVLVHVRRGTMLRPGGPGDR